MLIFQGVSFLPETAKPLRFITQKHQVTRALLPDSWRSQILESLGTYYSLTKMAGNTLEDSHGT